MLTESDLAQFTGTASYYKHGFGNSVLTNLVLTDGAKHVADEGKAWWLIDAIASHQTNNLLDDPMLRDMQFWKLQVNDDRSAVLICERDANDVALTQDIPFTDFPLKEIRFYLVRSERYRVLMLPSEY